MNNYSIVIPVGRFSFFVNANVENIHETTWKDPDIVFLTSHDPEPHIQDAIDSVKEKHSNVRSLEAPFHTVDHLKLLDWAIREDSLNEWMVVQHSDFFWKKEWINELEQSMKTDNIVVCFPNYFFLLDKQRMPLVGDYFGAYKRKEISKRNLSFLKGNYSSKSVSSKVSELVSGKNLTFLDRDIKENDFLDGSQIMSLEIISEDPSLIKMISPEHEHLVAFFRIAESITWVKELETLYINLPFLDDFGGCPRQLWIDSFAKYSFITSLLFDKKEVTKPLPWSLMEKLCPMAQVDLAAGVKTGEWLRKYSTNEDVIGMDDLGIKKILFRNQSYSF